VTTPSVLLVEDSATLRYLLTQALEQIGLQVRAVDNAARVVDAARSQCPAVIVMNKMLPGRDGHSLLPELRALPELAGTRIMMLTDSRRREDVIASIERGADDYVLKPFEPSDLALRVARLGGLATIPGA
jgi:twitching motility two-component system response regulator PilH